MNDTIKRIGSFFGELVTGILHPGNGLLFAKSLFFWVIVISLCSLTTLYMLRKPVAKPKAPETPKGALGLTDSVLAEIGKQKIYKSDVKKLAKTQYAESAITDDVLRKYLDTIIERAVLDKVAFDQRIEVTEEEIASEKVQFPDPEQKDLDVIARYQILKRKIIAENTNSVQAYVIGFWIPPKIDSPSSYKETPEMTKQRADTESALNEAEESLKAGQSPYVVTQTLFDKYPSLQPILGLNGYNFGGTKNDNVFNSPRTYLYQHNGASIINDNFYSKLFSLKENEIAKVLGPNQSGGDVIKVISIQVSDYASYEEFMKAKEGEFVKRYL